MAIVSLIIGFIVLLDFILGWLDLPNNIAALLLESLFKRAGASSVLVLPIFLLLVAVGLVLGIVAYRRKTRRWIALSGIALNSLVILGAILAVIMTIATLSQA